MDGRMETKPITLKDRLVHSGRMGYLYMYQALGLPKERLPEWQQEILRYWTPSMLKLYATSLGTRFYMDQDCALRRPNSYAPRAVVEGPNRMTEAELKSFYDNGFIGPLTAISPDEMAEFRVALEEELKKPSKAFGQVTVRDRHLDLPLLVDLFRASAISDRLAQILGPDLLLWRSQVFNHLPGTPPVTWHQATSYMSEDYKIPSLEPVDKTELFQLTVWIAIDHATPENGCMQFLPGTHFKTHTVKLGGDNAFYKAAFRLELDIQEKDIVWMELKPGQFVIFSERVVHGSPGNRSQSRRMGINFRVVRPTTRIYPGKTRHYASHFQQSWDLSNWGVIVYRGEDRASLNKIAPGWTSVAGSTAERSTLAR